MVSGACKTAVEGDKALIVVSRVEATGTALNGEGGELGRASEMVGLEDGKTKFLD